MRGRGPPMSARRSTGFTPNVDVYYCGDPQRAVVKVDLAGVDLDQVGIEVSGRQLAIVGERPVQETEGRVYQQVEIPSGPFRRVVELQVDVDAERAKATYEDGVLRIDLPLRDPAETTRRVPIGGYAPERDGGQPGARGGRVARRRGRDPRQRAAARRAAGPAAARDGHLPRDPDPAGGRPGALDQAGRRRARRQPDAGDGRRARPRERGARARRPLRGRRRRRRRPHAEGPRRDAAHPRPGHAAGAPRPLRRRGALPGGADRRAARRGRGGPGAGGADPQRAAHLLGDRRAHPLPARGAADGGRQHRRPRRPRPPDRRRAADLHRGEAAAAGGGGRRRPPPPPLPDPRPRARGRPARQPDPVPGRSPRSTRASASSSCASR